MPLERFRIKEPTIALLLQDGRQVAHELPAGAIITIKSSSFDDDKLLVNVIWDGKEVLMFTQDLRSRSERVEEASE